MNNQRAEIPVRQKLDLHMNNYEITRNYVLGVDIGGSHISLALIDLSSRAILEDFVLRKRVDPHGSAEEILETWCSSISECWHKFNLLSTRIGFAMPGPFNYATGVCLIKGFNKYESLFE